MTCRRLVLLISAREQMVTS